ncbi:SDR family NAD(P)-dependent oxidoreductase [Moheibacter sediminis]|uniref:NAD(P)-dependent dehydrogenase, short-chain alcohol dehydrogenase family n=1 Tax=Moheibacter sediminis TaxID=1434700 RepID=A0A1W2AXE3_9FLAO|nr:SDR family oxidoreductase [Moheibacter sediminis]SMC65284.1 NAD(P)-dependent dehydrogenase, short-chain alcohol dehydrogenase family [Moheibacter sediminis]
MSNKQKIALVTGGSRGLGKDMAFQLAEKGIDVIVTYQSKKDDAENVVNIIKSQGRNAAALQLDVAKSDTFDAFVNNLKEVLKSEFNADKIDGLVNNAGVGIHANFAETTEEQFDSMVNIHLKAPFFLTQKLLQVLNDGSSIVNISSGLARFAFTGYEAYATMKGAVETLSKYQAKFLGERKIRVNIVAPGAIETDFGGGAVRDNQDLNAQLASMTALGRVGLPDDIGGVVAFLISDDSKWVNAQRIEVSGGIFI